MAADFERIGNESHTLVIGIVWIGFYINDRYHGDLFRDLRLKPPGRQLDENGTR